MPVVDHILGYSVSEQDGMNELTTLSCLSTGLATLARQVALIEQPIQEDEQMRRKRISFTGFGFNLPPDAEELLPCYFHWFGTSVYNYARLTGFLAGIASGAYDRHATENVRYLKTIKAYCDNYVNSIPELDAIRIWRHKVFAHFAITDPRDDDNPALLDASVMSPVSYSNGRFRVGGMMHMARGVEHVFPDWSVTEAFEALGQRYWPDKL